MKTRYCTSTGTVKAVPNASNMTQGQNLKNANPGRRRECTVCTNGMQVKKYKKKGESESYSSSPLGNNHVYLLIIINILSALILVLIVYLLQNIAENISWPCFMLIVLCLPSLFMQIMCTGLRFAGHLTEDSYLRMNQLICDYNIKSIFNYLLNKSGNRNVDSTSKQNPDCKQN